MAPEFGPTRHFLTARAPPRSRHDRHICVRAGPSGDLGSPSGPADPWPTSAAGGSSAAPSSRAAASSRRPSLPARPGRPRPAWTYGPIGAAGTPGPAPDRRPRPTPRWITAPARPAAAGVPAWARTTRTRLAVVKRFLDGESAAVEGAGNQPYGEPRLDGDIKVFELTIDKIKHRIDAEQEPIDALGFNGTWPGPRHRRRRGRPRPGDLHEQPRRVDRHPLPRPAAPERHGRRSAHHPGPDPAGRVVHLRVHGADGRLAHVPLAPQRDRPGRPRAARARSSSIPATRPSASSGSTA